MTRPAAVALAAAFHEAGHAVASWRQGDGIGAVSIEPCTDPKTGARIGGQFTMLRSGERSLASGWGHRHLVTLFAGAAAQHRHDPRSCVRSCAAEDFRSARAFAAVMARSHEAERALLTWAQAEARALIATDWHLVEVLAAELLDVVSLDGGTAVAILDAADRAFAITRTKVRTVRNSRIATWQPNPGAALSRIAMIGPVPASAGAGPFGVSEARQTTASTRRGHVDHRAGRHRARHHPAVALG